MKKQVIEGYASKSLLRKLEYDDSWTCSITLFKNPISASKKIEDRVCMTVEKTK